ncbi:hypothetical protein M569_01450, partial [Genlisea aurea]
DGDSDGWSIGWLEPHPPSFRLHDDDGFAVLVPCYRQEELRDRRRCRLRKKFPRSLQREMLQRAASNACSWWWASHIRTKQSKWLEQSLQDMEDKVQSMIKLIEEDGDSFAKRAEMYYKRRPELITSVEEAYRSFKALADRYDMLSKELQNANHTIATVFPEQVQLSMEDEEEMVPAPRKVSRNQQHISSLMNDSSKPSPNVPKVPKAPMENLKGLINTASKRFKAKTAAPAPRGPQARPKMAASSGLSEGEALGEIEKMNKEILALQTIKEFVKSSYESGLAKYWEIENQIMEKQDKVTRLQDEFEVETVIEDDEARTLMAEVALKSCQETLAALQEKQENATKEAKEECEKVEQARHLLNSLRRKYMNGQGDDDRNHDEAAVVVVVSSNLKEEKPEEVNIFHDSELKKPLTVTELAEKIDELVSKVISLETSVSSQTVLIATLRTEADDLHSQIQNLEDEKETLIGDTHNLTVKVKELEERMNKIQDLNKNVETKNNNLQKNFSQARSSLDHLSEKLSSVRPDEEVEEAAEELPTVELINSQSEEQLRMQEDEVEGEQMRSKSQNEQPSISESENSKTEVEEVKNEVDVNREEAESNQELVSETEEGGVKKTVQKIVTFLLDEKPKEHPPDDSNEAENGEAKVENGKKEDDVSWQQILLSGTENPKEFLLKEYNEVLRNFKNTKKKLEDTEKKDKDLQLDMMVQMRELKEAILKRDQEIQHLRQRLNNGEEGNKDKNSQSVEPSRDDDVKPENKDDHVNDLFTCREDEIKLIHVNRDSAITPFQEKLREEIGAIQDENLDFWLRFSTSYHEVQKFKSEVRDLQDEILKLNEKKKQEGSATNQLKSEARPIYKHLREIQAELTVWLERSGALKDEVNRRFGSLCSIQEEITGALSGGLEDGEIRFSSHQAAKLHGEILNMKQENNKIREELESRVDRVSELQLEIEKTLTEMNQEFSISTDKPQLQHTMSRSRVPLRSFIFGTKAKKQRHSLFSFIHQNRKFQVGK